MSTYSDRWSSRSPWQVGQDPGGRWIVRDPGGLNGGIFISRSAALRFALFESGRQAAIMEPNVLTLDGQLPARSR